MYKQKYMYVQRLSNDKASLLEIQPTTSARERTESVHNMLLASNSLWPSPMQELLGLLGKARRCLH